jgi:hypothetical protein
MTRIVNRELLPAWGNRPIQGGRRDVLNLIDSIIDRAPSSWHVGCKRRTSPSFPLVRWSWHHHGEPGCRSASLEAKPDGTVPVRLVQAWKDKTLGFPFGPAFQLLIVTGARGGSDAQMVEIDGDTIRLKGDRTKNGGA